MKPTFIFQRELHHISNITETSESVLNYQQAFWDETALPGITTDIDILGGGLLAAKMTSWSHPASESLHLMSMRHWPQIFTTKCFPFLVFRKSMVTTTETVQFLSNLTLWLRMQNVHISHLRIVEFYLQNIFLKKKWIENLSVVTFAYAKCTFQSLG